MYKKYRENSLTPQESELINVVDKYNAKAPPSLSSQFKDRVKKADAVESCRKRQKRSYIAVSCR